MRRSYIRRRSRTLEFERSLTKARPRGEGFVISDVGLLGNEDPEAGFGAKPAIWQAMESASPARGLGGGLSRTLMAWFWMETARLSRQESETMRSARMDSNGEEGLSSSRS